jgi:glycosyltransferase involved in cell wall biosynthesis
MKKIKIYAVGSHQTKERTSGVDFLRVYQPMNALNGYTDGKVTFEVDIYDINKKKQDNWPDLAKKYDVVFLNYTVLAEQYAAMGSFVHGMGKKIIMDIDDAIWNVSEDNVVHDELKKLNAGYILSCMLDDVDGIVTTNSYLRNVIVSKTNRYHKDILVAPNQMDLSLYNHTSPAKDIGTITLMHYGSTSHFNDLLLPEFIEGVDRILKEYPNVVFKTVGAFISELRYKWGNRYINAFGNVDIYTWIKDKFPSYMDEADIMVVPLINNLYNRCKSECKHNEISSAMKPGVFSNTRPYTENIEHGVTGYLATTADDWYTHIKSLIDSKDLRQTIGENAYTYVTKERQMKDHVALYAEFIKKVLTEH